MTVKIFKKSYWEKVGKEIFFWHCLPVKTRLLTAAGLFLFGYVSSFVYAPLGTTLAVWAILIFFEVLVQKYLFKNKAGKGNILDIQLSALLLGIIAAVAPLLYFDSLYFLNISAIDFLSRYIWFLLPLSNLTHSSSLRLSHSPRNGRK
ncbi:MAG: hypothetical protein FJZ04_00835 [Candidatus Moranbacteria bacterium]|nr:hypothetical protein [Candidatus Moranbacteria bacterium]